MIKVLFITHINLENAGAGGIRIGKLMKYMSRNHDYKLTLIQPQKSESGDKVFSIDEIELCKIIEFKNIFKNSSAINSVSNKSSKSVINILIKLIKILLIPDKYILHIIKIIGRILNDYAKYDVIISSSPPNSVHISGLLLSYLINKPLIVDFRDGWAIRPNKFNRGIAGRNLEMILERIIIRYADCIITVTPSLVNYFRKYKSIDKIAYMPNGYDPEEFYYNKQSNNISEKVKIGYTGGLPDHRNIDNLIKAMKNIENVELEIWGTISENQLLNIKDNNNIKYMGRFTHKDVCNILMKYDWLLLVGQTGPGSQTNYSSKLFEYIASEKPILGLVPESDAKKLIDDYRIGVTCNPDNYNEVKTAIESIVSQKIEIGDYGKLQKKFDRKQIAIDFSNLIKEVVD